MSAPERRPSFLSKSSAIRLDRLDAQTELLGDRLIGMPLGQKLEHRPFAFAEIVASAARSSAGHERRGRPSAVRFEIDKHAARMDSANRP